MALSSTWEESREMHDFWLPNYEIHKRVIQEYIQYYLGPGDTVHADDPNPQGEDGYLISSPGEYLTDEQIDDICTKSKERWEKEAAARYQKDPADKQLKRPAQQPVPMSRVATANTAIRNVHGDRPRRRRSDEREHAKRRVEDRRRERERR